MDPEIKKLLDQIKEQGLTNKQATETIMAHFAEGGDFAKALKAIEQLEADQKALATDLKAQLDQMKRLAFDRNGNYRGMFGSEQNARGFGLVLLSAMGSQKARAALAAEFKDIAQRAQGTIDDSEGGALVDPEFSTRILRYVEEYGVFPAKAFRMPMSSNTLNYKKQIGEPTVYLVGEGEAPTESSVKFALVALTARKWGSLVYYPEELGDDAVVSIAELIGRSMAWAFAYHADRVGFTGTGTPADMRVTGVIPKLLALDNTIANIAGLVVGAGNEWSELVLADFVKVEGTLPQYAANRGEWYCSRAFFFNVMVNLMLAKGGVTAGEVEGRRRLLFNGNPVNIVQVMPRIQANSQVCALFGDLSMAADHGVRGELRVRRSTEYKFAEGMVTTLATARQDIQVHSVGNASATPSAREPGPIVGLITAQS